MSDLAYVFHWSPQVVEALTLSDFLMWREQAIRILKEINPK